ncbi:MAG TPA: tetratricopeptide repeat protein, partial [Chloroflexi bacterium]|nr:tetratricopeptide repeat protein [Chloroflexota bacterium]
MKVVGSNDLFQTAAVSLDLGHEELGILLLEHLLDQLPTHLGAHCLVGKRHLALGRLDEAAEHFERALSIDPVRLSAIQGVAEAESARGVPQEENAALSRLLSLYPWERGAGCPPSGPQEGLSILSQGRILTRCGRHLEAAAYYRVACSQTVEDSEERAILELILGQALWAARDQEAARPLLEKVAGSHASWVRPRLLLADMALRDGEDAKGVALLHDARALDSSGAVARELLEGRSELANFLEQGFSVPTPAEETVEGASELLISLSLGDPVPPPATETSAESQSVAKSEPRPHVEPLEDAQGTTSTGGGGLDTTVDISKDVAGSDGCLPESGEGVRLVLSSRRGLVARYGEEGYRQVDERLSGLCQAAARSTGDETIKLYVDEESSLQEFGVEPVDAADAPQITGLLIEIDSRLRSDNRGLRSLLIIGGDKIIPFHRLANPADDDDPEILSDWPYAAVGGQPLASRFAVGRIPDNRPDDVDGFLGILDHAIAHHQAARRGGNGLSGSFWRNPLRRVLSAGARATSSVCYTAQIWAEASRSVFGLIGDANNLEVSPPLTDYDFLTAHEQIPGLSYFNLHGFQGSPYWYGHGESEDGSALVPVALTPLSLSWSNVENTVVYSEACYGADLAREYPEGSIPVNFLKGGALAFVGSTSMSYGALEPPLSGADLLGVHLWEGIVGGLPTGDALRRARASFVQSAAAQQGYLDGEDQKALLSFVLYGDPSLRAVSASKAPGLDLEMEVSFPPLACCSRVMDAEALPLPKEVRQKVQRSLPFVQANGLKAHPLILCTVACANEESGTGDPGAERESTRDLSKLLQASQQQVVCKGDTQLRHVVKVTVNAEGDV